VIELIRRLVETESPSGYESGSRSVVSLLEEYARSLHSVKAIERIPVDAYGEHLRIHFAGSSGDRKPILILGHTDTVHSVGSLAERPWRVDGNRIYGPGIFDMKANCVMALEAVRAVESIALNRPVVLLLTCDEETGSATGRALVEEEAAHAKAVLVLEPPAPGGVVKTGRKGTGLFSVAAKGIAAHAGLEPEKGASAVLEMARQIERLHSMTDFSRGTTVNVGVVQGGTRPNVIAENATAEVDLRFTTSNEGERLEKEILTSKAFDERVRLTISGGVNRPPMERNERALSLFEVARGVAAEIGFELRETQVGGASDGNFAAAIGAAVLDGLGIDGDGAHAAHEHIVVDDIPRRTALLAGLLMSL
jgi:glutamate carboxypeptidase